MDKKERIISLSAIGLDAPGLISKITETILQMHGNILDVEETCRRGMFSQTYIVGNVSVSTKQSIARPRTPIRFGEFC